MFYYYDALKMKYVLTMTNILYVYDEFGMNIKKYEFKLDDEFKDFSQKIYDSGHIISCGIFGNFCNKSWMMATLNKNRDVNNINPDDYKNEPNFINALVYNDDGETQIHEISLNKIDIDNEKYSEFNNQAKNNGGKLLNIVLPIFYQNNEKLENTKFRLCNILYDEEMVGTMIIRSNSEPEKQKYFDNPIYKYEFSNQIELDVLYEDGCLNA